MNFSVFSTAGLDYNVSIFNTALFSTGNTLASLSVGILQDSLAELSETFNAMLMGVASKVSSDCLLLPLLLTWPEFHSTQS